jgi:ATP-binding cassette subfamily F protein uup
VRNEYQPSRRGSAHRSFRKLSYKLQRELDALPGTIDALEKRVAALQTR